MSAKRKEEARRVRKVGQDSLQPPTQGELWRALGPIKPGRGPMRAVRSDYVHE